MRVRQTRFGRSLPATLTSASRTFRRRSSLGHKEPRSWPWPSSDMFPRRSFWREDTDIKTFKDLEGKSWGYL